MPENYLHHRIQTKPLAWQTVADELRQALPAMAAAGGVLYGVWRSQIGRPRDELNVITAWGGDPDGQQTISDCLAAGGNVAGHECWPMQPTLRPQSDVPPTRQGNYAFRHFRTPAENWDEFLQLCAEAWPGFEASYEDTQVIGLWRFDDASDGLIDSLLLTRRPNLASWERSKLPQGARETEVRRKLSRRYDLCDATYVYTATLLTASDHEDEARWT